MTGRQTRRQSLASIASDFGADVFGAFALVGALVLLVQTYGGGR